MSYEQGNNGPEKAKIGVLTETPGGEYPSRGLGDDSARDRKDICPNPVHFRLIRALQT